MGENDPLLAEIINLRKTVSDLNTSVAVNTAATESLQRAVSDVQQNSVPRAEWNLARQADLAQTAMVAKAVADMETAEAEKEKSATTFRRQMTFIALGAVLTSAGSLIVALILLVLSGGKI